MIPNIATKQETKFVYDHYFLIPSLLICILRPSNLTVLSANYISFLLFFKLQKSLIIYGMWIHLWTSECNIELLDTSVDIQIHRKGMNPRRVGLYPRGDMIFTYIG